MDDTTAPTGLHKTMKTVAAKQFLKTITDACAPSAKDDACVADLKASIAGVHASILVTATFLPDPTENGLKVISFRLFEVLCWTRLEINMIILTAPVVF